MSDNDKDIMVAEANLLASGLIKPGTMALYDLTDTGRSHVANMLLALSAEERFLLCTFFVECEIAPMFPDNLQRIDPAAAMAASMQEPEPAKTEPAAETTPPPAHVKQPRTITISGSVWAMIIGALLLLLGSFFNARFYMVSSIFGDWVRVTRTYYASIGDFLILAGLLTFMFGFGRKSHE